MAIRIKLKSTKSDQQSYLESWALLRPELKTPGYWPNLSQNCAQWADDVFVGPYWKAFDKHRSAWSNEFHQKTGGALLARDELPKFFGKGYHRIQTKIRQLTSGKKAKDQRELWPEDGPPVPRLNDLVRTRIVCQFLDGIEFIANKLVNLGEQTGTNVERTRVGRLEGYFAQHLYFPHDVLFRFGGGAQQVSVRCEVQIATELATRIWLDSHVVYEEWRGRKEARDWQWNPKDPRFLARQLGHMIHLADGLLVQLRDARAGEGRQ